MIKEYLDRLKLNKNISIDYKGLAEIQKAHLLTIPFENFDIHLKGNIDLDTNKLFHKIVKNKRGGLCYETHYLLYTVLKKIGFCVEIIGSQTKEGGNFYDHPILKVYLDNKIYIVDVGFGDNFFSPIELKDNNIHIDNKGTFRLTKLTEENYLLEKERETGFEKQFVIRDIPKPIEAFFERKEWYVTSIDSLFTKDLFCSKEYANGRVSLKTYKIKYTKNNRVEEIKINDLDTYFKYLEDIFSIFLSTEEKKILTNNF